MAILTDPLPPPALRALRSEVLRLRAEPTRTQFPHRLHVGAPGGHSLRMEVSPGLDHALRCDLVHALFGRYDASGRAPALWLSRPGTAYPHDQDLRWLSAARATYAELGAPLTMLVVTRTGWYDPRSGVRREWVRPRDRSHPRVPDGGGEAA